MIDMDKYFKKYINEEGMKEVEEAIIEVEKTTSAELVPVVVKSSSTTNHVPGVLVLILSLLLFIFNIHKYQEVYFGIGNYAYIFYVLFVLLGAVILSQFNYIKRILTPGIDQLKQVEQRAIVEFYESNIKKTRDATGILFFVSLMEKRAVVLADEAISAQLPKETWDEVVGIMVSGVKQGNLSRGISKAILASGRLLTPLFPIKPDDTNELSNKLVLKD